MISEETRVLAVTPDGIFNLTFLISPPADMDQMIASSRVEQKKVFRHNRLPSGQSVAHHGLVR